MGQPLHQESRQEACPGQLRTQPLEVNDPFAFAWRASQLAIPALPALLLTEHVCSFLGLGR
jgi:hypothetical protein